MKRLLSSFAPYLFILLMVGGGNTAYPNTDGDMGIPSNTLCRRPEGCHYFALHQPPGTNRHLVGRSNVVAVPIGGGIVRVIYSYQLNIYCSGISNCAWPVLANFGVTAYLTVYREDWEALDDVIAVRHETPVARGSVRLSLTPQYGGSGYVDLALEKDKNYIIKVSDFGVGQQIIIGAPPLPLEANNDESYGATTEVFWLP